MRLAEHSFLILRQRFARFDAEQQQVAMFRLLLAESLRLLVDRIGARLPAGGVHQFNRYFVEVQLPHQVIARGAGLFADQRLPARQGVEKAALARVRAARQHQAEWPAANRSLVQLLLQQRQLRQSLADSQEKLIAVDELDVLVGEIQAGFEISQQVQQVVAK